VLTLSLGFHSTMNNRQHLKWWWWICSKKFSSILKKNEKENLSFHSSIDHFEKILIISWKISCSSPFALHWFLLSFMRMIVKVKNVSFRFFRPWFLFISVKLANENAKQFLQKRFLGIPFPREQRREAKERYEER